MTVLGTKEIKEADCMLGAKESTANDYIMAFVGDDQILGSQIPQRDTCTSQSNLESRIRKS
jgi:hypothetical protein